MNIFRKNIKIIFILISLLLHTSVYCDASEYKLKLLWKKNTDNHYLNTPLIVNNKIYQETGNGKISVLDISDGETVDEYFIGKTKTCQTPVVKDGTLFLSCNNNYVEAINLKHRSSIWKVYIEPKDFSRRMRNMWELSYPSIEDKFLCVSSQDANIYLVNVNTGRLIWEFNTGKSLFSAPLLHDGIVYFTSSSNFLNALDASNGKIKWQFFIGEEIEYGSPVIIGKILFVAGKEGTIFAVDTDSHRLKWKEQIGKSFRTNLSVNEDLLCGADENGVYGLDPLTGKILWIVLEGAENPVIYNDLVLCLSKKGELLVIDALKGKISTRYDVEKGSLVSKPAIAEDKIVVTSGNGIFCFQLIKK